MSVTMARPLARRDEGPRVPGPIDKAAIILLALDDERSQLLFAGLEEDEIRRISRAMARLGRTPLDLVEQTVGEFRAEVSRTGNVMGTAEGTEKLLLRIMPPDKVAEIMGGIKGPDGRAVWEKLANIPPPALASYLRNEYPQTAAVILGRLPPQHAARVLALLPEPLTGDVALRMLRMDSIHQSVLSDIEETLEREFVGTASGADGTDSVSVLAELLNRSDREMVARVLAALEDSEPDAAARIRRMMFTFDDLARVDPSTFGVLIAECPVDKLAVGLSTAPPALRDLFLSSMSERAANMLRDEIETMPTPRKKAVEDAQAEIIVLAKRLVEEGRIFMLEDGEAADE